jgi:hypothetical protein
MPKVDQPRLTEDPAPFPQSDAGDETALRPRPTSDDSVPQNARCCPTRKLALQETAFTVDEMDDCGSHTIVRR